MSIDTSVLWKKHKERFVTTVSHFEFDAIANAANEAAKASSCRRTQSDNVEVNQQQDALAKIGQTIHYPECWDTAAYPTIYDALHEMAACFGCSECNYPGKIPDAYQKPDRSKSIALNEVLVIYEMERIYREYLGTKAGFAKVSYDYTDAMKLVLKYVITEIEAGNSKPVEIDIFKG